MVGQLLRGFASLFEVHDPWTRTDRRTATLLVLVVLAGAALRFWGLGSVGLHGDEKTMSLPTMHLVEHGTPLMPSGMFYPRAVGQLYLMAASVKAFGKSEWAMRVPSAVCGVLLIVLAWKAGRRFLTPAWNLALAAAVAFLPAFIEDAQTARMYVFLATSVAGFIGLVFEWERTDRTGYLIAAVAVMLIGLQFHTLAVFAAFLVFIPGLLQGDLRKLGAGALAFAAIVAGFFAINAWISSEYPQSVGAEDGAVLNGPHAALIPNLAHLWLAVAALPALAFAGFVIRWRATFTWMAALAAALLASGIVAELALSCHLAGLLIIAGLVLARREDRLSAVRIVLLISASVAIAATQAAYMYGHAAGSPRQIAGAMLGWPSVWPFLSMAEFSPAAGVLVAAGLAAGLWRVAHRERVPDHLLFVVLGVWIPLLMIGLMRWDIPPRYAQGQVIPLLVGAFATAQWAAQWLLARRQLAIARSSVERTDHVGSGGRVSPWGTVVAAVACVLVFNPVQLARAVDSGYANHPDHKGAAEFVASLHPGPRDIIVAEDVLQQTYYLGHVDYWLVNKVVAAQFMHQVNGRWLDFYTNTPLAGTGQQLQQLVDRADRGAIYVIGSGENQEDGRKLMRAFGIAQTLQSPRFHVIYRGRDGLTQVWKVDPPQQAAARK
jgi:uncharacterized membrane protein